MTLVAQIGFEYGTQGGDFWLLSFSFHDGEFGTVYDVGDVHFRGSTAAGTLFAPGEYLRFVRFSETRTCCF